MKDHLSYSQIATYLRCPLQFKFQYIDELKVPFTPSSLAFGGAIHKALAFFYRETMEGRPFKLEEFLKVFEGSWQEAQEKQELLYKDDESFEGLLEKGKEMLRVFARSAMPGKVLAVEEDFEIELEDPQNGRVFHLPLIGTLDLVEQHEGRPLIVEHKTAGRRYTDDQITENLQLSLYAAAAYKLGLVPPYQEVLLRLDALLKTKNPDLVSCYTARDGGDQKRLFRIVSQVWKGIQEEVFYPNPSFYCSGCLFAGACREW